MAKLWYSHFDSTEDDPRVLIAEDWARFIRAFLGDGIKGGGGNLQVEAADYGVAIKTGMAHIQGYVFELIEDLDGDRYKVPAVVAHPTLNRIDRLVLRLDRRVQVRGITPAFLVGEAAAQPVPPVLSRNANIWEMSLAQVRIPAGATAILPEYITDERLNPNVCGIIDSLISADTEGLYNDFQAAFLAKIDEFQRLFMGQMAAEDQEFDEFMDDSNGKVTEIQGWYDGHKADIAKLQTFVFNNMAEMPGCVKNTQFEADGSITETISMVITGRAIAEKKTEFKQDGRIVTVYTVYDDDGQSPLRRNEIEIDFAAGISETVLDIRED